MKRALFSFLIVVFSLLLWLPSPFAAWGASEVAVFYPDVREPYLSVFNTIISGISSRSSSKLVPYPLPETFTPEQVTSWLKSRRPAAIITLGSRGFQMAQTLDDRIPVIVGAVLLPPNGLPGISMAADPVIQLQRLKELAPATKRVFVVYNPAESEWLVERAKTAAPRHNLELVFYPANDLRAAVTTYRDLIEYSLTPTDAVWLPMDDIGGNDKVVLPMLLEAAWKKKFILFSSKPSHAKQGALFSQFPDNFALGQNLAEMTSQALGGKSPKTLMPSRDLQTAVNLRTAAHLGLAFSSEQKDSFQLKFP